MFGNIGHPEPPLCFVDVCAHEGPETANVLHYSVPILGIELDIAIFINLFLRQKPLKCKKSSHSNIHKTFSWMECHLIVYKLKVLLLFHSYHTGGSNDT